MTVRAVTRAVRAHGLVRRAAVAFVSAALVACASSAPTTSPATPRNYEFRLVSEVLKDQGAPLDRMYWVDNDRLLFLAYAYGKDGKPSLRPGLYLWRESEGKVRLLAESASRPCYSEGVLSYFSYRDDRLIYAEGSVDAVQETDLGPVKLGMATPQRVHCRAVPPGSVPLKLLPLVGGGFLEDRRLAPGGALPYRYYPRADATPIELPINPLHTGPGVHRYSEYTRSYIFQSTVFNRDTKTTPVLQVFLDGTTRTLTLTDGPWSQGVRVPQPTAHGWLLATALNGVYLMWGGEIEKISPGQVWDIAVSPDGCRAALKMHFEGGMAIRPVPVYTLNLCAERDRK